MMVILLEYCNNGTTSDYNALAVAWIGDATGAVSGRRSITGTAAAVSGRSFPATQFYQIR